MEHHEPDINDLGLVADMEMLRRSPIDRRLVLKMGAAGIAMLLAGGTLAKEASAASAAQAGCVAEIPEETAGPFPADGSLASGQRLNALALSGIVRSDIRTSLGTGNTALGVPCQVILRLVNTNANCAPLSGYAVYGWHCDRAGRYSLYSSGVTGEDYLRGVQATGTNGGLLFTTIFPGCYAGRWPHIHFEVYPSLARATSARNVIHTSQLALPEDVCSAVYATGAYPGSALNLSRVSLTTDGVFRDGVGLQMATVTGNVRRGYTALLTVGIAV